MSAGEYLGEWGFEKEARSRLARETRIARCPRCRAERRVPCAEPPESMCGYCHDVAYLVLAKKQRSEVNKKLSPEWVALACSILDDVARESKRGEWRAEHHFCAECLDVYATYWRTDERGREVMVMVVDRPLDRCGDCESLRLCLLQFSSRRRHALAAAEAEKREREEAAF